MFFTDVETGRKKFVCTMEGCDKSFFQKYKLDYHVKNIHLSLSDAETRCRFCGKKLATAEGRQRHENIVHRNIKEHICDICYEAFSCSTNLMAHKRSKHGARKLRCNICNAEFNFLISLKDHKRKCQVLDPEKSICPICGQEYAHARSLKAHMDSKHSNKRYVCEICRYEFTFPSAYRKHMKRKHPNLTK